jgi:hypothetical protein
MLLLIITLPIIPYCTVLSLGKEPFLLRQYGTDWEALTAPVVKFIPREAHEHRRNAEHMDILES